MRTWQIFRSCRDRRHRGGETAAFRAIAAVNGSCSSIATTADWIGPAGTGIDRSSGTDRIGRIRYWLQNLRYRLSPHARRFHLRQKLVGFHCNLLGARYSDSRPMLPSYSL